MILNDRDIKVLNGIADYEILSTSQFRRMVFDNIKTTTVLRRMRKLEAEKYIKRAHGLNNGELCWLLTPFGAHTIGRHSVVDKVNKNTLEHDISLNDIRLRLENGGIAHSWTTEQQMRRMAPKYTMKWREELIPDGLFAIRVGKTFQVVALELELSAKNPARYAKLFKRYGRTNKFWGVWYVVGNSGLGSRLANEWIKVNQFKDKPRFGWALLSDVIGPYPSLKLNSPVGNIKIDFPSVRSAHPIDDPMSMV